MEDYQSQAKVLAAVLKAEGIADPRVLSAITNTPRHLFIAPEFRSAAYANEPLPIGHGQTISQPYVVAKMSEVIAAQKAHHAVLEIGTGSGYQAAILSQLFDEVYTVERIKPLLETAEEKFKALQLTNIHCLFADGNQGWKEHSPYNAIIVTAATDKVPPALLEQLAEDGRLVIPVGSLFGQELQLITRRKNQYTTEYLDMVMFVPLLPGKETQ